MKHLIERLIWKLTGIKQGSVHIWFSTQKGEAYAQELADVYSFDYKIRYPYKHVFVSYTSNQKADFQVTFH